MNVAAASLILSLVLLPCLSLAEQNPGVTIKPGSGQRGDWNQQVAQYKKLLVADPQNGDYWHNLAYAQEMSGDQTQAIDSYKKSIEFKAKVPQSYLGIARVEATRSRKTEALEAIRKAVLAGLQDRNLLLNEPLFEQLRNEPHFATSIDYLLNPVHRYPDGDALTFWLGEWLYSTPDGITGGFSRVAPQNHGFSVVESWTSADGSTARSIYTYDKETKQWVHTWMGPKGEVSRRTVKRTKDGLEMNGVSTYPDGTKLYERELLKRLPEGKIEQTIYQSRDQGETWIEVSKGTFSSIKKDGVCINLKGECFV